MPRQANKIELKKPRYACNRDELNKQLSRFTEEVIYAFDDYCYGDQLDALIKLLKDTKKKRTELGKSKNVIKL